MWTSRAVVRFVCIGALSVPVLCASCGGGELEISATHQPSPTSTTMGTSTAMPTMSAMPIMPTSAATLGSSRFFLIVDAPSRTLTLSRGGQTLLALPTDALQLGTVDTLMDSTNYDPYPLAVKVPGGKTPAGLTWISPISAELVSATTTDASLTLAYPGGVTATLQVSSPSEGVFTVNLVPSGTNLAYLRLRPRVDPTEGFYGLGEYYDHVEHRGRVRAMQLETDPLLESSYNEAHVPVPLLIGTNGWGLFVENPYPAVFEVANQGADLVQATFGSGTATTAGIRFHLLAAETPLDITGRYYQVSGPPTVPARWALGPWLWRDENKDQAQVLSDLHSMRDLDLPHTAIWLDRPYATGVQTFDFLPSQFPDPTSLLQTAHDLGFHVGVWHVPYEDQNDPNTATLYGEAKSNGYFPPTVGLTLNKWGPPIDFTNPAAYAFWQQHIELYTNVGIEGFKLDYGEDIVPGLPGIRTNWVFSDGSDERTMHSRYSLLYHQVYAETLPSTGGFLLCRHGSYGDQNHVSVIWPGDLDSNFAKQGDVENDGTNAYTASGGLPAALIAGLSLGPSGFPFYGSDTGGYRHGPPNKELFTRWFEQTSLSTVMQIGNGSSTVAWEPDMMTGYDEEMLGWYRTYTRLHLRLFAYEWSYAQQLHQGGRAIQRPLGLAYPALGVHPDDEYMFGDHLLVAPVVTQGQTSRSVIFPPGTWTDWWTGDVHQGGTTETVDAPLGALPLYLAQGAIVPLLRPTIDTMAQTIEGADQVDSYATTPGELWPRIVPGPSTSFLLFDDSTITQEKKDDGIHIVLQSGSELNLGTVLEILGIASMPTAVTESGNTLDMSADVTALDMTTGGYSYDPSTGGHLYVKVPAGHREILIAQ